MHLLQQLRDGFKPQIHPAALTLQKIVCLSTDFIPTCYLPSLPYPAAMSELSFALYSPNPGIRL